MLRCAMWLASILVLSLTASGCAPLTRYRQTLLTLPAAPPHAFGAPLEEGVLAGGAWVTGTGGIDQGVWVPDEHTPGVLVPPVSFGGQVRSGLAPFLEVGMSLEGATDDRARRSAVGVLPLVGRNQAWAFGTHATFGYTWPSGFGVGATLDGAVLSLPFTRYELREPPRRSDPSLPDEDLYDVSATGTARPVRLRLTHAVSYRSRWFDGALGLALAPQATNQGFSDTLPEPLREARLSFVPAADLGVRVRSLRLGVQTWYAFGTWRPTGGAYAGLGARATAEVRLGRW